MDLSNCIENFIEDLENLGISEWNGQSYSPIDIVVLDGTQWVFSIAYGTTHIHASGCNAYPPHFDDFLELLHEKYGVPEADIEHYDDEVTDD